MGRDDEAAQRAKPGELLVVAGRYLNFVRTLEGWEYVEHNHGLHVVAALGITHKQQIVLVKQHRPPIGASVLELPAGLAKLDDLAAEAAREFLEETGFRLKRARPLFTSPVCSGLTSTWLHVFAGDAVQAESSLQSEISRDSDAVVLLPLNWRVAPYELLPSLHRAGPVDQTVYSALLHILPRNFTSQRNV